MEQPELELISAPTAVKIIEAAGHLFMQRGYKAVSINDIITAADVTKPTLYYYFSDKAELFVQMGLRITAAMGVQLRNAISGAEGTAGRLRAVAEVLMADHDADMRMMRHEMFEHLGPAQHARLGRAFFSHIFAPIVSLMEAGLAAGELTRYEPVTLAKMFMAMSESFQEFSPRRMPSATGAERNKLFGTADLEATTLVDLFLNGVGGCAKT